MREQIQLGLDTNCSKTNLDHTKDLIKKTIYLLHKLLESNCKSQPLFCSINQLAHNPLLTILTIMMLLCHYDFLTSKFMVQKGANLCMNPPLPCCGASWLSIMWWIRSTTSILPLEHLWTSKSLCISSPILQTAWWHPALTLHIGARLYSTTTFINQWRPSCFCWSILSKHL